MFQIENKIIYWEANSNNHNAHLDLAMFITLKFLNTIIYIKKKGRKKDFTCNKMNAMGAQISSWICVGWKYGVRLCIITWSSQSKPSHHSFCPRICSNFLLIPVLESNGSFLKLGHWSTRMYLKDGKGRARPYILLSFGSHVKVSDMSLEKTPKWSTSISKTSLLSSSITFSIDSQNSTLRNWRLGAQISHVKFNNLWHRNILTSQRLFKHGCLGNFE